MIRATRIRTAGWWGRWAAIPVLSALIGASAAHAEAVISKEGRFEAVFPGAARMSSAPVQSGPVTLRMTAYAFESGTLNYYVSYSDYPPETFAKTSIEQAYSNVVNATLANLHGELLGSKPLKLGNVAGREVIVDVPGQHAVARERLFLVGTRLYQVMYGGPPGTENGNSALAFLSSFKLLP